MGIRQAFVAPLAFAAFAALGVAAAQAQALSGPELAHALQRGGYVLVMRHASSPVQPPLASAADSANVAHERQLDEAGRNAAVAMGRAIKSLHIPLGDVWTSPTYRARQTVALAKLPQPTSVAQLGDGGQSMSAAAEDQSAWLRGKAAEPPRPGTDALIVTHLLNMTAAFGQEASSLPDGAALVFHPVVGGPPELVGRVGIEEWPRLAGER